MAEQKTEISSRKQSQLDESKVREAAAAILAFHKKKQQDGSKKATQDFLLNDSSQIKLIISLWKIVGSKAKTFQINIPHSLRTPETEVCLFTKDDHKMDTEATKRRYQELLQSKGVTEVNEVMPLQILKKEYKAFESRRQLAKRYDVFLADERILRLMHVHLGKEFYKRKKYPTSVNMTKNDLRGEIQKAINTTRFILSHRGNTNHLTAAHTGMTLDQVVENIVTAVKNMTLHIPLGWDNIKALYVRTDESVSLPLHTSLVFKEWETQGSIDGRDIWRLKKQLQVTADPNTDAKPRPTIEEDVKSKKFVKRSKKKAASGEQPTKKAIKRKAEGDKKEDEDAMATPAKSIVREKPKMASTSLKKGKKASPVRRQTRSFSAKKGKGK